MTTANRVYFECADIHAVQLECTKCGACISYPPDKWEPGALKCPNCSVTLVKGTETQKSAEWLVLEGLSSAVKVADGSFRVSVTVGI